jgi:hypothetical protein
MSMLLKKRAALERSTEQADNPALRAELKSLEEKLS